jgi:Icc-related predicted phosphoesterase
MRCHYMSDLHLERQDFPGRVPEGDLLILAGDICQAACLDPARTDPYMVRQRERVLRFIDRCAASFERILMVAGNHEHYGGDFDDTLPLLRRHLPGVTVLENETAEIAGMHFFGATLWSDFEGRSERSIAACAKGMSEYFVVARRMRSQDGGERHVRLRPTDTLAEFDRTRALIEGLAGGPPTVVVTHHAPSRKSLNALFMGNGYDGAFASSLDDLVASLASVPAWVHGHTHVQRSYPLGGTMVRVNCRGYERERSALGFRPDAHFDI